MKVFAVVKHFSICQVIHSLRTYRGNACVHEGQIGLKGGNSSGHICHIYNFSTTGIYCATNSNALSNGDTPRYCMLSSLYVRVHRPTRCTWNILVV